MFDLKSNFQCPSDIQSTYYKNMQILQTKKNRG